MLQLFMTLISSIASAVSNFFSWASGRSAAKNTAEMKVAVKARQEVDENDKVTEAIKKKDVDEIRKRLAE